MMTPQEVANCTFAKSMMGGYNMASVDDFLDKLTEDYTALYKENAALKAKLKMTVDKMSEYRESEDAIRSTLLAAQKMSTAMLTEAEQKRDAMISTATADAQARVTELRQQIAEEERRLSAVQFQVDKELEAERKRLTVGQEQLRKFIKDVRAVCNEELAQLELLPELPAEEPKPEPVVKVIAPPAEAPAEPEEMPVEEVPMPVNLPEGEEVTLSHDELVQAISAFAPAAPEAEAPVSPVTPISPISKAIPIPSLRKELDMEEEDGIEDPFAEDELEDTEATRTINLDDLQFGPNYTKD